MRLFSLLLFCLSSSKILAADQVSLNQQLQAEKLADLARDARTLGNANRGAILFFQPFLNCAKCHDAEMGANLGPDISRSDKDVTAEHLIESILWPSKVIKKNYETVTIATTTGKSYTGILIEEKNGKLILLDTSGNNQETIATSEIEDRGIGKQSIMPEGLANLLSDRQQFLDLTKYLIEIAEQGPTRAKTLRPAITAFTIPEYEKVLDHRGLIQKWDAKSLQRGEAIYSRICANCHGTPEQPGSLPTSPKFISHQFKNGSDPYSMYRTLTHGYNMMAAQSWMVPQQKYDVIYYIREAYLKKYNPSQLTKLDENYLVKLPTGKRGEFGPAPASVEPWMAMDYGPNLFNTYEIDRDQTTKNIAYKSIALRLDAGAGGISRGNSWALFDHDTLRFAAAWTGSGFIDWKGIHFNGQHQVHPKIIGTRHIINPVTPGWANPETGKFEDPRPLGRDNKPYGPLPRTWGQFQGIYAYGDQTILAYNVGNANILELAGIERDANNLNVFTRTLEIERSDTNLNTRLAPINVAAAVIGDERITIQKQDGHHLLQIPASVTPIRLKVFLSDGPADSLTHFLPTSAGPRPLKPLTQGGPKRWPQLLETRAVIGKSDGPFAVDTFALPERNPWNALMRLTGFDFYPDGNQMAVCTWDGDVWKVTGIRKPEAGLQWQRIASGLFQPLGLKFRDGSIFVCCRDQIVKLNDLNNDGETDFYECFNNDHQVTEHFHEFAMGLQTDSDGNFYYAKSGRHALDAVVPHHGTLLKVTKDGSNTEILATGFRAANGVCLNPDGTYFVTDQEGFWTPKNRINMVEKGGFYGNLWGYTDITDTSDNAMNPPLCWITNTFDRSPAELVWVPEKTWGPLGGSLLNTSYGMGKIYVVPYEKIGKQAQGGMSPLPLPTFPTGIMRPRFNREDGSLFVCGMFAWAGNQTTAGGFYRVRYTGKPVDLPIGIRAKTGAIELTFTEEIAPYIQTENFKVKVWSLKRSKNYGSKHYDEKILQVTKATILKDGKSIRLDLPDIAPTHCMEIQYQFKNKSGETTQGIIHNTIHELGK